MLVLAALAFTALFGTALLLIGATVGDNLGKIAAALQGRSQLATPLLVTRPVTVRMVPARVSRPTAARPRLRAAA